MSELEDAIVTPIDRPLMRSDLDAVRRSIHRIETFQIKIYEGSKRSDRAPKMMATICFACALVSIGCAVAGLSHAQDRAAPTQEARANK